jgi:hypothetical protein
MRDSINLLKRPVQVVSNNVNFLHLIVVIIDLYKKKNKNVNNLKNIFLLTNFGCHNFSLGSPFQIMSLYNI